MGMLVNGKWTDRRPDVVGGRFVRPESQFRNFIDRTTVLKGGVSTPDSRERAATR
jgi:glutathionyl-hydroquinone reductase